MPATGGVFQVDIVHASTSGSKGTEGSNIQDGSIRLQETQLWDRKTEGGFPETKQLKKLVRDIIDPSRDLGHVDRHTSSKSKPTDDEKDVLALPVKIPSADTSTGSSAGKDVEVLERKTVDIHQIPTAAETATAEDMVAEIMTSFQSQHAINDGPSKGGSTPGIAASATEKAGSLVAGITESFRQSSLGDEVGDFGGGSGGLGTGMEQVEERIDNGKSKKAAERCQDCG
ncbi:MAG: hypothetical protein Q9218_000929 [Villophora microphyllina]